MRHPRIVVLEGDGLLAKSLLPHCEKMRWLLVEERQMESCRRQLQRTGSAVLVLKLGRNLVRELGLLRDLQFEANEIQTLVVSESDDPSLQALAYDLGASYVMLPPIDRLQLTEIVEHLMLARLPQQTTETAPQRHPHEDLAT